MRAHRAALAAFAACFVASTLHAQAPASSGAVASNAAATGDLRLQWLDPAEFAPDAAFAPPPARGSADERTDLERIRALIAAASPARLDQARWDGEHEDASAFSAAAGRDLLALPATSALLALVQGEVERVVTVAKIRFARPRPYQVDPALPHCGKGKTELRGYPSGHSGMGWAFGWTLARLMPAQAPALLARAQDYGVSRLLCGSHFSFDVEASHAMAVLAAEHLLADPRLADKVAAARAELAR